MTKFNPGDRLKAIRDVSPQSRGGIRKDHVYVVRREDDQGNPILTHEPEGETSGWDVSNFELYAKAGEFVEGDWVVPNGSSKAVQVSQVLSKGRLILMDGGLLIGTRAPEDVHLATPEEIAAATPPPMTPNQDGYFATETKKYNRIFTGNPHPVAFERERAEIPAAEFDFSTIKAGDLVLVQMRVDQRGSDGEFIYLDTPSGTMKAHLNRVSTVIPAPKPKTLRERAIERVFSDIPGAEAGDETKGVVLAGGQVISLHAIVDAVLAEVEKEQ